MFLCVATVAAFIYFPFRIFEPDCFISSFNIVSSLNQTSNNNSTSNNYNPTIKIPFTVVFLNHDMYGLTYTDIDFTMSVFVDENTTRQIGRVTITDFYQWGGNMEGNPFPLRSYIETRGGELNGVAKVGGKMYFRIDLSTRVKYSMFYIYMKHKRFWGGANVAVDDFGMTDDEIYIPLGHSPAVIE